MEKIIKFLDILILEFYYNLDYSSIKYNLKKFIKFIKFCKILKVWKLSKFSKFKNFRVFEFFLLLL